MQPFAYARSAQLQDAIAAAATRGTYLIAGGTELLNWMKEGIVSPARLVDINALPDLDRIVMDGDRLRIGALARMSAVARDVNVVEEFPALAQALEKSASQQIRNMASMGGNLLQRTRCPYFRAEVDLPCNKRRAGSGCAAREGVDRTLAIFGGSEHCIATHPSDAAVALVAYDAMVHVQGSKGRRDVALLDLYRLPGTTPHIETTLAPDEVIVEISIPRSPTARHSHYLKIRERASYEFALVSAAAGVDVQNGTIRGARLALGGVAPKPWRLSRAEAALIGVPLHDESALRGALASDFADAQAGKHNGFKVEVAQRTAVRAVQLAGGAA